VAGYSATPLQKKLGITERSRIVIEDLPDDVDLEIPVGASVLTSGRGATDVIVAFFLERTRLEQRGAALGERIRPDGGLWIAWPKRTSKVPTDLTDDVVRSVLLPIGLVDTKVCAIDDTWTGLRFVWRRALR
jgi:hypothetical protein